MKKYFVAAAFLLCAMSAAPSFACFKCGEYFDYQALDWCVYCDTGHYCGYELCHIEQFGPDLDGCVFDGSGCNAHGGRLCPAEPYGRFEAPSSLQSKWKLTAVTTSGPDGKRVRRLASRKS